MLAAGALAQARVWVVDAANGAGTDFTDIAPAVAAANDGDLIRIRAGVYTPFGVSKALRFVGGPNVTVRTTNASQPAISIGGLGAGKSISMRGLLALRQGPVASQTLRVVGNLGVVFLEDVTATNATGPGLAFLASNNAVIVHGFGMRAGVRPDMLLVFRCSFVSIQRSNLVGSAALAPNDYASAALDATDSSVEVVDSLLRGGDGDSVTTNPPPLFGPSPAILAANCTLRILGTAAHPLRAGSGPLALFPAPVPAVRGGLVEVDPAIPYVTHAGAPPFAATQKVTIWPLAALAAAAAPLGGTFSLTLRSPPQDPFAVALSEPRPALTALGISFLDPATLVPIAAGTQGAGGITLLRLQVPLDPVLRGLVVAAQAGNAYLATNRVGLTNVTLTTIDG